MKEVEVVFQTRRRPRSGLYCGIDLHSTNSYVTVIDRSDRVVAERRLASDLEVIVGFLAPYREAIEGVAVEVDLQLVLAGGTVWWRRATGCIWRTRRRCSNTAG